MEQKKFKNLDLKNAFLFATAMEDSEICRLVLEIILDRPVSSVTVRTEHSLLYDSESRSVRLDAYAEDEVQTGYNLEMQNQNEGNLPRRSRYHQAELDIKALKPGEDFSELKSCYVIFICTFDPFHEKLYRYTFEERCTERDFPLGDGTYKIFLNTKGENQSEVPKVLVNFLKYVEDSTEVCVECMGDERIAELHRRISAIKESREWEGRYMTLEELLRASSREAENRMLKLIVRMTENGEAALISKLEEDRGLLEQKYEQYKL